MLYLRTSDKSQKGPKVRHTKGVLNENLRMAGEGEGEGMVGGFYV